MPSVASPLAISARSPSGSPQNRVVQSYVKDSTPGISQSPGLVHFPILTSTASCQFMATDVDNTDDLWKFCLIGFVAGKFPGYAPLSQYIAKHWKYHAQFTMHDSSWLIFAFPIETTMLEVLSGGPYYVFGRPLILQVMLDFFYSKPLDLTKMPT